MSGAYTYSMGECFVIHYDYEHNLICSILVDVLTLPLQLSTIMVYSVILRLISSLLLTSAMCVIKIVLVLLFPSLTAQIVILLVVALWESTRFAHVPPSGKVIESVHKKHLIPFLRWHSLPILSSTDNSVLKPTHFIILLFGDTHLLKIHCLVNPMSEWMHLVVHSYWNSRLKPVAPFSMHWFHSPSS